ncbi:MAG: M42 family metallopeptidase [Clostridia bacterium]|nr:M42 family metallopeptidase [Clostridia bacterium]MBQ5488948.1 M42 family metallopeptidase [Clostridia bacterium]
MDYTIDQLKKLMAIDSPSGFTAKAADYICEELTRLGYAPEKTRKGCVLCCLGGEGTPVVFSAHIDTLGGMVASIKSNGRLKLTRIGGMNPNNAETENAKVYTRDGKVYEGCFQMNDPSVHVNGEYSKQERNWDNMELVLDEKVFTADATKALGIATGDYVCFDPRTTVTASGYIKSRFLDDKLSAAILMDLARRIKEESLVLTRKVYIYMTVFEEVGHGCSSGIPADAEEIISVDMGCVGEGLECKEHQVSICVKDSHGPYNYELTDRLVSLAKKHKLDYALDVYPFYGSDADAALDAGYDLRHGLIGAGVYASHGYERSHVDGARNTLELVKAYVSE